MQNVIDMGRIKHAAGNFNTSMKCNKKFLTADAALLGDSK